MIFGKFRFWKKSFQNDRMDAFCKAVDKAMDAISSRMGWIWRSQVYFLLWRYKNQHERWSWKVARVFGIRRQTIRWNFNKAKNPNSSISGCVEYDPIGQFYRHKTKDYSHIFNPFQRIDIMREIHFVSELSQKYFKKDCTKMFRYEKCCNNGTFPYK